MGGFPTSKSPIISLNDAPLPMSGLGVPLLISLLTGEFLGLEIWLGLWFWLGLEIWLGLCCSWILCDVLLHAGAWRVVCLPGLPIVTLVLTLPPGRR